MSEKPEGVSLLVPAYQWWNIMRALGTPIIRRIPILGTEIPPAVEDMSTINNLLKEIASRNDSPTDPPT